MNTKLPTCIFIKTLNSFGIKIYIKVFTYITIMVRKLFIEWTPTKTIKEKEIGTIYNPTIPMFTREGVLMSVTYKRVFFFLLFGVIQAGYVPK